MGGTIISRDHLIGEKNNLNSIVNMPSKHETYSYNVVATAKTLGRRCINVMQIFCARWVDTRNIKTST